MAQLKIENLHVEIDGKEILKGVDLEINEGEIHAIMGPNGNGKSTLLSAIMGHPRYEVTEGRVFIDDVDVLELEVDERSKLGLFLGMQYPQEVSGVTNSDFLKSALNAHRETPIGLFEFVKGMESSIERLRMKEDLAHRFLNEGFSGGEKKRNEILQMIMLQPRFAMLDEIDSGLDIDALALVARVLKEEQDKQKMGLIIVSHYERFFELIKPTHTHIMMDGKIVLSSDDTLVTKIDREGYDWLDAKPAEKPEEHQRRIVLESCAIRDRVGDK
ncbi:Fe-S cluster assembly ATPase SufC [Erysipelothrix sp. HDW6C]|uniref:Fe-S cluster assembly ATPase SufC n=1 Tax=Erysipelothrix sp. HDW6C TaxID=2714930 RepID=UPI00140E61E1|nr:Fe-S cluster assembly ATPase SufC [Erysipelothrix sp. HDW6C]QIK70429.1 Fe-S cluster assembly ATPase SufC [Erysipelothrix sp. HDW6C]